MARTVSIRRSLITNLTVVVVLLGISVLAMVFLSGQRASRRFAQSLIDQTIKRTESQLRGFFDPAPLQLEILASWVEDGLLDVDTEEAGAALSPVVEGYSAITSVMVADDRGAERMLLHTGDRWRSRVVKADEWGNRAKWVEWVDDNSEPVRSEEELEYDPRTRPWFQGAVENLPAPDGSGWQQGEAHWTEPYTFFTTKDAGITASLALRAPDGRVVVLGLDVTLMDISRFTTSIRVHRDGAVFVMTADGRLVGLPWGPRFTDEASFRPALLKRPEELGGEIAVQVSKALLTEGTPGGATRVVAAGETLWGEVRPFALGDDQQLLIGVIVAEEAILGDLQRQRLWIELLILAFLLAAVWRAIHLGSSYSRPIEALVEESGRIAQGDLEPGERIDTRVEEVNRLAEAHEKMRAGLKTLLKIEHDLQIARRIQRSTFPDRLPAVPGFDLAAWSEPADETGGDTYDVIGVKDVPAGEPAVLTDRDAMRAILLLADATGHGIGPALSVTQVRAMMRIACRVSADLSTIPSRINEQLCADLPPERFITAWFGEVDGASGTITAVSAGQAPILRYDAARDEFEVLNADSLALGMFDHVDIAEPKRWTMGVGDIFAVISDGIYEAKGPDGEDFGVERTLEVVRAGRDKSSAELLEAIREAVETYTAGAAADDDRTMILIKRVTAARGAP
jgi:serine phosphatase RsbU (regulator of sigma subunit)